MVPRPYQRHGQACAVERLDLALFVDGRHDALSDADAHRGEREPCLALLSLQRGLPGDPRHSPISKTPSNEAGRVHEVH
jgi:hypothetical protein